VTLPTTPRSRLTPKARVKAKHKWAGAELSAMRGFRIMDYTDPYNPKPLSGGRKTEAAAWRDAARKL